MAFDALGTLTENSGAGTSEDVAIPSHSAGDLLVLFVAITVSGSSPAPAISVSGWTLASHGGVDAGGEAGNASAVRCAIYWKEGNGSETTVTITCSGSMGMVAQVGAKSGMDTTTPVVDATIDTQESGNDIDSPAGTTGAVANCTIIRGFVFDDDISTEADHDSDGSWQGTSQAYGEMSTPGNGMAAAWSLEEQASAGAIAASTYSSNGDSDAGVAVMAAFQPSTGGISNVNPDEFDMDADDVDVESAASDFDASGNTVYISDADTLAGGPNEVDISSAINTEAVGLINLDLTGLSAGELADLQTLGPGARYIIVETSGDEFSYPITLHRPMPFELVASANIAASGEDTTERLAAGGTFGGGRAQDDENPTDATDISTDQKLEDVFNIQAKPLSEAGATYDFRELIAGVVADTITQTPQWTVSSGAITGAHIPSTAQVHAPSVAQNVTGAHIASTATVHAPSVSQSVEAAHIPSTAALYAPTVAVGAVGVQAAHTPSTAAVFAPSIAHRVDVAHIASTVALYAPTVSLSISTAHIASTAALYAPTIAHTVVTAAIPSTTALYPPTVALSGGAQAITGGFIAAGATVFAPSVAQIVSAAHIASGSALHPPVIAQVISAAHISSGAALYPPSLSYEVMTASIASTVALYAPTVLPGAVAITAAHIASTATLFPPSVAFEGAVVSAHIPSGATLYPPAVAYELTTAHIAPATALHPPAVVQTIAGGHIGSTVDLYAPSVTTTTAVVGAHIAQGATLYAPSLGYQLQLESIASSVALFAPSVVVGAVAIQGAHVTSTAVLYPPVLSGVPLIVADVDQPTLSILEASATKSFLDRSATKDTLSESKTVSAIASSETSSELEET